MHVRDVSHPDRLMHHTTVMAALHSIELPPTTPIVTVDNKADLLQQVRPTATGGASSNRWDLLQQVGPPGTGEVSWNR